MSLFEEMIESRRRGEMAVPTDDGEEEPPEVRTGFLDIPGRPGVVYCTRCGAMVAPETTLIHGAWHQTVGV